MPRREELIASSIPPTGMLVNVVKVVVKFKSNMDQKLTILKLGGSIVTYKKQGGGLNKKVVQRLAQEIKTALGKKSRQLILVHGAGGKAHALAHRYGLQNGALGKKAV